MQGGQGLNTQIPTVITKLDQSYLRTFGIELHRKLACNILKKFSLNTFSSLLKILNSRFNKNELQPVKVCFACAIQC